MGGALSNGVSLLTETSCQKIVVSINLEASKYISNNILEENEEEEGKFFWFVEFNSTN